MVINEVHKIMKVVELIFKTLFAHETVGLVEEYTVLTKKRFRFILDLFQRGRPLYRRRHLPNPVRNDFGHLIGRQTLQRFLRCHRRLRRRRRASQLDVKVVHDLRAD